jgi:hypothetical protein
LALAVALVSVSACESTPARLETSMAQLDVRRCKPGPGTTGSPTTIAEAVGLLNSLPAPVTVSCFVEALDRPLRVEATSSKSSAQPAAGARSPRVFLWTDEAMVVSLAVDGEARNLVEFGQFVDPSRSIKGELEFPISEPVKPVDPLERVRNEEFPRITTCFVCHDDEEDEADVPRGRSSLAIRPRPNSIVGVEALRSERESCDHATEPDRCALLDAMFAPGPVEHRPFDASLPVL